MNRGKRKVFVTVTLIVVSLIAAVLVEAVGGAAGSASTPHSPSTRSTTIHLLVPAPNPTTGATIVAGSYKTVGARVNLRSSPSTSASVLTVMLDLGSPVTLTCYVRGDSIGGDPWWYRASFVNAHGYVAGYWVNTGPDPAKTHLAAC